MVSIVIPVYNAGAYLAVCLNSLLRQTEKDWEAILIDDASTDNSADIARTFVRQDSRFHLLLSDANNGQAVARNRGLDIARGEFIAFLDSDDWWDDDFLERHLRVINELDFVQSGYRRMKDDRQIEKKIPVHQWQFTSAWARLYRKEALSSVRFTEGIYFEDVIWTVDLFLRKPRIRILDYVGYNYRLNPYSTTSSRHDRDRREVLRLLAHRPLRPVVLYTIIKLKLYFLFK